MILDTLAATAKKRVAAAKERCPLERLQEQVLAMPYSTALPFREALSRDGLSFICEVKRASPSKGLLAPSFPYCEIAADYEAAGADCISVLTEPSQFMGDDSYLREIAARSDVPLLRKDFTVDAYQIYEAKLLGASAVLLICALLDTKTLASYLALCRQLGLSAIVEAHDDWEVGVALAAGADIIGVNNRNLQTFAVDLRTCIRLRERVPAYCIYVAESGMQSEADVEAVRSAGADAVLIGELLMRSADRRAMLRTLRGQKI